MRPSDEKSQNRDEKPAVDPKSEAYWRQHYQACAYRDENEPFEAFSEAYRLGAEGYGRYYDKGLSYEEAEPELEREYEQVRGERHVPWEKARPAAREAWHRVQKAVPEPSELE